MIDFDFESVSVIQQLSMLVKSTITHRQPIYQDGTLFRSFEINFMIFMNTVVKKLLGSRRHLTAP